MGTEKNSLLRSISANCRFGDKELSNVCGSVELEFGQLHLQILNPESSSNLFSLHFVLEKYECYKASLDIF